MNLYRHIQIDFGIICKFCRTIKHEIDERIWLEEVYREGLNVIKSTGKFCCPDCDPTEGGDSTLCRLMYRIELFTPQQCPHCASQLNKENKDWIRFLGIIVNGVKIPDPEYPRIVCQKCNGEPFHITMHEERQLGNKEEAEKLCRESNFVNMQEVMAYGNMTKDHVVHYTNDNQPRLKVISADS